MNSVFKQLKPHIIKKFKNYIVKYVKKKINTKKLKYHSSYSVMTKGYKKSPHIDRRDHLIHMIFYSESDASKGGEIIINKVKKKRMYLMYFPQNLFLKFIKNIKYIKILFLLF